MSIYDKVEAIIYSEKSDNQKYREIMQAIQEHDKELVDSVITKITQQ